MVGGAGVTFAVCVGGAGVAVGSSVGWGVGVSATLSMQYKDLLSDDTYFEFTVEFAVQIQNPMDLPSTVPFSIQLAALGQPVASAVALSGEQVKSRTKK